MNIRQVEPRPEALRELPAGDRLFHFFAQSSDGKTEYFVAVHQARDGSIRTACQCMDAIVNFVGLPKRPCCKHAAEAMKIANWELRVADNSPKL
jgi:predicted nucleic acid-binding Zn finger protein